MGQRLSAISPQRLRDRESGDQVERAKCPDFRACEAQVVNRREPEDCVAGAGGIEPPNGGIKIRCLTAWLRPKRLLVRTQKANAFRALRV